MVYVCENCGAYRPDRDISPDGKTAICPECGHAQPILLRPLLIVTGASGAGKSSACEKLRSMNIGRIRAGGRMDYVVMEGDMLWDNRYAQMDDDGAAYNDMWLRVCMNISQGGQSVLLAGCNLPHKIENRPARRYFSDVRYLALVCRPEILRARLKARPSWRNCGGDDLIAANVKFNNWFCENAASAQPRIDLIDTSDISPDDTARQIDAWVQSAIAHVL